MGTSNESVVGKIGQCSFQSINRRISETVQDRTMTDYRLAEKLSTLDDLERPICTLLQKIFIFRCLLQKF